jgi:hypothetical protein
VREEREAVDVTEFPKAAGRLGHATRAFAQLLVT